MVVNQGQLLAQYLYCRNIQIVLSIYDAEQRYLINKINFKMEYIDEMSHGTAVLQEIPGCSWFIGLRFKKLRLIISTPRFYSLHLHVDVPDQQVLETGADEVTSCSYQYSLHHGHYLPEKSDQDMVSTIKRGSVGGYSLISDTFVCSVYGSLSSQGDTKQKRMSKHI